MARIFVFGSNLAGRHGAGSAQHAKLFYGAIYGQGFGRQGNSFAIPTKGKYLEKLPLPQIRIYVEQFLNYAEEHPELTFDVVAVGCGLAGFKPDHIGPMFSGAGSNIVLPPEFEPYR